MSPRFPRYVSTVPSRSRIVRSRSPPRAGTKRSTRSSRTSHTYVARDRGPAHVRAAQRSSATTWPRVRTARTRPTLPRVAHGGERRRAAMAAVQGERPAGERAPRVLDGPARPAVVQLADDAVRDRLELAGLEER